MGLDDAGENHKYNGKHGVLQGFNEKGKWNVTMYNGKKFSIAPENLKGLKDKNDKKRLKLLKTRGLHYKHKMEMQDQEDHDAKRGIYDEFGQHKLKNKLRCLKDQLKSKRPGEDD